MDKKLLLLMLLAIFSIPFLSFATYASDCVNGIDITTGLYCDFGSKYDYSITGILTDILNNLWIIFTAIAVIMFVIAGILFLTASGAPEKLTQARSALIWGVVGIVVAIIAYSIIAIISSLLTTPV
jgi:hypothetical protein